jgi:hypothetical protein
MLEPATTAVAMVQVTNLAVHARLDENRGAVLVTDLRRGAPVRDATVTLRDRHGQAVARASTDSSGVAVIDSRLGTGSMTPTPHGGRPARLVDVEHLGDRAVLPVSFDYGNSFDASGSGGIPLLTWQGPDRGRRAFVFTDRDLYRPGSESFWPPLPVMARYSNSARPTVMHDFAGWFTPTLMLVRESSRACGDIQPLRHQCRFVLPRAGFNAWILPGRVAAPARRAVAACQSGDVRGEWSTAHRSSPSRSVATVCRTSWGIR